MRFLFFAVLLSFSSLCRASMPVEVEATADDPVGRQLVFRVKEAIRTSSSMELSFDESKARMQVHMVTLDQSRDSPGLSTAYSVVLTWNNPEQPFPFYLNQYTGYCGADRVKSCAEGIVANTSEASDAIIKLLVQAANR